MSAAEPSVRAGRTTGSVYGLLATALVVLLALLAWQVHRPPPPLIVAFAPGAVHQIKQPPPNQAAKTGTVAGRGGTTGHGGQGVGGHGAGAGAGGGGGGNGPGPGQPAQFLCVGDPPRQIEDPQSPPCIPYWSGDNGGATAVGVTRNAITVSAPGFTYDATVYSDLQNFFNEHFQFYGRHLVISTANSGDQTTASGQNAEADNDYSAMKPFGSLVYWSDLGAWYRQEITRLGAIYSDPDGSYGSYPARDFGYLMDATDMENNLGQWACNQLAGHHAQHAGAAYTGVPRKFGVILHTYVADDPTNPSPLVNALRVCGADPGSSDVADNTATANDPTTSQQVLARMKADGVTTIFCLCQTFDPQTLLSEADSAAYQPEWIFSSYGYMDDPYFTHPGVTPADQLAHSFGLTFQPPMAPLVDQPVYWAVHSVDPSFSWNDSDQERSNYLEQYRSLLLLASGIQMAGPHLTPQTFAEGLARTVFPNPPYHTQPGKVGFQTAVHTMTLDAAEWWWSNTSSFPAASVSAGPGTACYVDNGRRFTLDNWPHLDANQVLFSGPCNNGAGF